MLIKQGQQTVAGRQHWQGGPDAQIFGSGLPTPPISRRLTSTFGIRLSDACTRMAPWCRTWPLFGRESPEVRRLEVKTRQSMRTQPLCRTLTLRAKTHFQRLKRLFKETRAAGCHVPLRSSPASFSWIQSRLGPLFFTSRLGLGTFWVAAPLTTIIYGTNTYGKFPLGISFSFSLLP